jgi:hypothetical protein
MDIDSERQEEMVPSPPHAPTVQRETSPIDQIDHVDLVAPLNVSKRYCSRSEDTCMGSLDSAGGRRTCKSSWYLSREKETSKIFVLYCSYEPHH